MKLYRNLSQLNLAFPHGCVLTIGNFDGVHLGHQSVLTHLKSQANQFALPAVVMLFEPQPNEYFQRINSPARLMHWREKFQALRKAQIDAVICLKFNKNLASMTASDFIRDILIKKLKVKFLSIGDDFHFGRERQGNFAMLQKFGNEYGFQVVANTTFRVNQERVSSTAIRQALAKSDFIHATELLGKPFSISGKVIHGNQLGRTINVPTANIALHHQVCPLSGVFVVKVQLSNGSHYQGVANLGCRPSVNGVRQLLEVHLFNFQGNLYGKRLTVVFYKKLRNEQKFASFKELKQQIYADIKNAKTYFDALKFK